jgi:flagellar motility protein MotE (MotC chaperone)
MAKLINISSQLYKQNRAEQAIKVNSFFIEDAEASTPSPAKKEEKGHGGDHGGGHGGEKKEKEVKTTPAETVKPTPEGQQYVTLECNPELSKYSPDEIKLLQNLSQRRKEIEQKTEDLNLKEKLLKATEVQVNSKVSELKALKLEVEGLLAQYNEKENQKLMSLVKIYESMKPQDAAKIFDALDMPILLQVISNMKEAKVAPILSKMDPNRAREVSIEYTNNKKISDKVEG